MIIDLKDVQKCQSEFIEHLEMIPGIINPKNKFRATPEQGISLVSELMEVCNASKLHKWWDKSETDKDHVIEELADALAHIANIANYTGIELVLDITETQIREKEGIVLSFLQDVTLLVNAQNKVALKHRLLHILHNLIELNYSLGFSIEELKEAYHKKLKINYTRFQGGEE